MRLSTRRLSRLAALGLLLWAMEGLRAEEGGSGDYILGSYASIVNITPNKPGFAASESFIFYQGDAGANRTLPFGGLLATDLNANVYLDLVSLAYTFSPTLFGAHYTAAVAIPYVWMDIEAKTTINPRLFPNLIGSRSKVVSDGANGLSDLVLVPVALNWTFGDLQINPQLAVYAPTGDYQKGQLANPGKNHWMFDTLLGVSYLSHKTGTEFTLFAGYGISTENPDTHYRNGDIFHLETTLSQYLPLNKQTLIGVGANAFLLQQVTGDSGSGAG
jgi:hypothetical protein